MVTSRPVPCEMVMLWDMSVSGCAGPLGALATPGRACVTLEGASVTGKGWAG